MKTIYLITIFLLTSTPVISQENNCRVSGKKSIVLDLAEINKISLSNCKPGNYKIMVKNMIPNVQYQINSDIVTKEIAKLDKPNGKISQEPDKEVGTQIATNMSLSVSEPECSIEYSFKVNLYNVFTKINSLIEIRNHLVNNAKKIKTENEVKSIVDNYNHELKSSDDKITKLIQSLNSKINNNTCLQSYQEQVKDLESKFNQLKNNKLIENKTQYKFLTNINENEKLTFLVSRNKIEEKTDPSWTVEIDTPTKGKWIQMWSIAIVDANNKDYFTQTNTMNVNGTDMSVTTIKQKTNHNNLALIPAAFYTYVKNNESNNGFKGGFTLGLGIDTNNLTPFLGYNFTYHDNLGLTFGIAAYKRTVLAGEYQVEQQVDANTQNLTTEIYKADPFIALSFRFN